TLKPARPARPLRPEDAAPVAPLPAPEVLVQPEVPTYNMNRNRAARDPSLPPRATTRCHAPVTRPPCGPPSPRLFRSVEDVHWPDLPREGEAHARHLCSRGRSSSRRRRLEAILAGRLRMRRADGDAGASAGRHRRPIPARAAV